MTCIVCGKEISDRLYVCGDCLGSAEYERDAHGYHRVQGVVALTRERDALRAALVLYGKHKPGCASGWRAATGSSQIGPCDCGLDQVIEPGVTR